jgi:tetratricopeptide (TPR) repeat protein
MKDFFISYNKADRSWAEWMAWHLEAAGYSVLIQAWDFLPGTNFVLKMDEAAKESQRTIAVLSPDYLTALYTQSEWAAAFAQDPTSKDGKLLPIRVRECDIKGLLGQIVYVDLVSLDEAAAKNKLLTAAKGDRAKPDKAPAFPPTAQRSISQKPRFPGSLPVVWNIPHLRNPNFTGREELLADLRAGLTSGKSMALTQAIHGMGGVGKTQLAVEYAYRFASEYDIVWWVQSEKPATLVDDYGRLAEKLGFSQKDSKTVEQVKGWLRQNRGWLLIFDNAPDAASVRDYIPGANTGHVIVTSRSHSWKGIANPLSVKVLPIEEAIAFMLNRTGQTDETAAKLLAEALGCLPLALEQASAYIEATGSTIPHYLNLFQQNQQEILRRADPSGINKETVATTWNISFQQVEKESPTAADLMKLFAFLAPEGIPKQLLIGEKEFLPEPLASAMAAPLGLDDALLALHKYSLVEVSDDAISVHRLIQSVTRFQMNEDSRTMWIESAVCMVNSAFPTESGDVRTWGVCSPLLPHALTTASYAEADNLVSQETARLLNQAGLYLDGRAEFAQAKALYERALTIDEAALGPDHPNVATRLNNLGGVLRALGDLAGAKANLERALQIFRRYLGEKHPSTVTISSNLRILETEIDAAN